MSSQGIQTIDVYSAEGGQGTTTVAGAIAHHLDSSVESQHPSFELTWGSAMLVRGRRGPIVRQLGRIAIPPEKPSRRVAVIRGPSVAGAIRLAHVIGRLDAVVLIHETWRSIAISDLEGALRHRVDVTIPHSPRIARLADAGLLMAEMPNLSEFAQLREWVERYR